MIFRNPITGSAARLGSLILLSVGALLLTGCGGGTPDNEAAQSEPEKSEAFISDGALNAAQQAADALENESMHRALQIPDGTGDTEAARREASKKQQEILKQAADEAARATQSF